MLTIGVSGHRKLNNLEDITIAIDEVLHKIIAEYGKKSLQVISPLAEGADRLVVWRAIKNFSVKLIVPLPLEISDYVLDFESAVLAGHGHVRVVADQDVRRHPRMDAASDRRWVVF